jgi:hypothetical protein
MWSVLGKVIQRNARFALTVRLHVYSDHVRIPVDNGGVKMKGRSLSVLSALKRSIVTVKEALFCLAHTLISAMAKVNCDTKYASYRDGMV